MAVSTASAAGDLGEPNTAEAEALCQIHAMEALLARADDQIKSIAACGTRGGPTRAQLPALTAGAQNALAALGGVERELRSLAEEMAEGNECAWGIRGEGGRSGMGSRSTAQGQAGDEGDRAPVWQRVQSALQQLHKAQPDLRQRLRHVTLTAQQNLMRQAQQERDELLGAGREASLRRRKLESAAQMAAAAEEVTSTLRRTRHVMEQEVQRGVHTLEELDTSATVLTSAGSQHSLQHSRLSTAHRLLALLKRGDVTDR
ncbi:hypothetical protein CLOM_g829 [Closterium sp. NIES-68]|nr:hypothetical protein CLOM_g829 [Closterium sp. NIES-68]GJP71289.1 hypothetical protein CLOP_g2136 [Closterium sp. NIES-67]